MSGWRRPRLRVHIDDEDRYVIEAGSGLYWVGLAAALLVALVVLVRLA